MRLVAAPHPTYLTYCTNVHAAEDLAALEGALVDVTVPVARAVGGDAPFGVGLRLGEEHANALTDPAARARFATLLRDHGLFVFTINGFPQAAFHAPRVKERVYRPWWGDAARTRYTLALARLMVPWLPPDDPFGTISTVPIGWRRDPLDRAAAEGAFLEMARALAELEADTGARIMVCIEPEPDCAIETIPEAIRFFDAVLAAAPRADESRIRRHVGLCYDACHQAVLFSDPEADFDALAGAGISVGKFQISAALRAPYATPGELTALAAWDEDRFLHQVAVRRAGAPDVRCGDLPELAAIVGAGRPAGPGEARCHFHVPVDSEAAQGLATTQGDLASALRAARAKSDCRHFEVETYTFDVLPQAVRDAPLATHLARELTWARNALEKC